MCYLYPTSTRVACGDIFSDQIETSPKIINKRIKRSGWMCGWVGRGSEKSGQIFEMEFVSSLCESVRYREVLTTYTYLTPTFFLFDLWEGPNLCIQKTGSGADDRRMKLKLRCTNQRSQIHLCVKFLFLFIRYIFSSALCSKGVCSFRKGLKIVCLIFLCYSVSESSFDRGNVYRQIYFFF